MRRRGWAWAPALAVLCAAGCAVPQPRGDGEYYHIQEPSTQAWYNLYLPVDYVHNKGIHPLDPSRKWPLVMTFHGMKPYDNALPQEREWEKEADFYGYIVCAPELKTSDSFMEYPLTKEHDYVLQDKRNVIFIMDHIFATTRADPRAVLSTSWSCGGYLAHYFVNRFPNRFSCLATRLSNFSSDLLLESTVPLYRDLPVAVFIGDGDFPACKSESEQAVAWYTARNFRTVRGKMIDKIGHQRIPQTAAAFFAEQLGIKPLHAAEAAATLARIQMTEYQAPVEMIAAASPPSGFALAQGSPGVISPIISASPPPSSTGRSTRYDAVSAGRNYPFGTTPAFDPNPDVSDRMAAAVERNNAGHASGRDANGNWLTPTGNEGGPAERTANRAPARSGDKSAGTSDEKRPGIVESKTPPTAARSTRNPEPVAVARHDAFTPENAGPRNYPRRDLTSQRPSTASRTPASSTSPPTRTAAAPVSRPSRVNIQFGGPAVGTAPHYLAYAVDLPSTRTQGADFLWMDNGVWMGDEPRGVKILETPGVHRITVLVVTSDNQEYRGSATVQVLRRGPIEASDAHASR